MEYKIIYSDRSSIAIQVSRQGELIIRAPKKVSKRYIDELVASKSDWIQSKVKTITRYGFSFSEGDSLLYLGEKYILKFSKGTKVEVTEEYIIVPDSMDVEKLKNWFKFKAEKLIVQRFKKLGVNFSYKNIRLSNARTRYGSCNNKGNINLSWRLIFAPLFVIDYVIIHELVHIEHMNHSSQFWNKLEQEMPDYKNAKQWLKENNVISML